MTIVEIKNQLISHYYDKNVFDLEIDGPTIQLSDELESVRKEVIESVLSELAALGMVKIIESAQKSIWVLTQSFDSFNQTVVLSAAASEIIGDIINEFRSANEISGDVCDKTKISESDIMNLVNICQVLLETDLDLGEEGIAEDEEE